MKAERCLKAWVVFGSFVLLLCLEAVANAGQTRVIAIAANNGGESSLFLKSDGSLWDMGYNDEGQLGNGTTDSPNDYTNYPEMIVSNNVIAIIAGELHSLYISNNASLWGMGYNYEGQLGTGAYTYDYLSPLQLVASNVIAGAGGWQTSLFIKNDGSLWGTGQNGSGELGLATNVYGEIDVPEKLASNVLAVAEGEESTLFIETNGSLWGMGDEGSGELGDGTYGYQYSAITLPEQIIGSNVVAVAMGTFHSLILKSDGSLWGTGQDSDGQLGNGATYAKTNTFQMIVASNVTAIAAGYDNSLFIKKGGSLWAMGENIDGQLGDGTTDSGNYYTNLPEMIVASNVTAIAGGGNYSLFLESDGSLWGMGANGYGQLGLGLTTYFTTPTLIVPGPLAMVSAIDSGTNLIINASGGPADVPLVLLSSANLALPPAQWTPVVTNTLSAYGYFSVTVTNGIVSTNMSKFYMFKEQ